MNKAIYVLIVLIALFAVPISAIYTDFYKPQSNKMFSVIGNTNGDSYYEERCVDVSSYLSRNGCSSLTDSNGCPMAKCTIALQSVYTSCAAGYDDNRGADKCATQFGSSAWRQADRSYDDIANYKQSIGTYAGVNPTKPSSCTRGALTNNCFLLSTVTFGGMEKVLNTCSYDQNDLLVGETFAGGQSISKLSLRYPIKSFCRAHPSIITDDSTKESITSTNIPQDLIDGKSVAISSSQTLTVFYVIENNQNLPTICNSNDNLAINADDPTVCLSTLGFTYLCSEGQFDALTGTCVVQPESKTICEKGRYDLNLDKCVWNPPIQVDCGDNACFYSVDREICSCVTTQEFVCPEGFTLYQPSQSECSMKGDVWLTCPQCPIDKICPESVCSPRCDKGTVCIFKSPSVTECEDADAELKGDKCVIYGELITECPDGYELREGGCYIQGISEVYCPSGYNKIGNQCFTEGEAVTTCPTGYTLKSDACYKEGTTTITCPSGYDKVDNRCLKEGVSITVCPSGTTFNRDTLFCEMTTQTKTVCKDGSVPKVNAITGKEECLAIVESFIECPTDFVYNIDMKKCVPEIVMIDPVTTEVIIYKEVYKQCTSDSDCNDIGTDFKCYAENGLCYKDVQVIKEVKTEVINTTLIVIIIVIAGFAIFSWFKKKRR
jgi:hypothetical protein